jgi:uncharacterized DUF497 family protein
VQITWDEPKRLANLDKHGLDFAQVDLDFFADAWLWPRRQGGLKPWDASAAFWPLW